MTILTAIDSDKSGANPPAEDRAASLRPQPPAAFSRSGIDFRGGPAAEWLLDRHDLARQLNEQSKEDVSNGD